jgi:hypothetical protein
MDHGSTDKEEDDRHLDWSALYWLERTVICVVTGERFFLNGRKQADQKFILVTWSMWDAR